MIFWMKNSRPAAEAPEPKAALAGPPELVHPAADPKLVMVPGVLPKHLHPAGNQRLKAALAQLKKLHLKAAAGGAIHLKGHPSAKMFKIIFRSK
jgi:hypothetical protein